MFSQIQTGTRFYLTLPLYFRYACLVCANRPVFDTVIVLSQHRQGKKHQACMIFLFLDFTRKCVTFKDLQIHDVIQSLSRSYFHLDFVQFQEKKYELDMLIKQRKQDQYLKDGTTDIKQVQNYYTDQLVRNDYRY